MPRVQSFELFHVALPLKKAIKHASHERAASDSLVVRVGLDDGSVGFGEGVPRDYVTGETIESTFAVLGKVDLGRVVSNVRSAVDLVERLEAWELPETLEDPRGMAGNAARCALELALFDAYGKAFGVSMGSCLAWVTDSEFLLTPTATPVRYSGAITAETLRKERVSAWKMRLYGFHQVKIKVGVEGQDDPARLQILRSILGSKMDIRIDANEAWSADTLLDRVAPLRTFRPTALEQPVPHAEVDRLAELRPILGIPVMLDESLCGFPDALNAVGRGNADILNVRLSKCGGPIKSLRIVRLARMAGLDVQLGCHPGETGLLSAAGRHFASNVTNLRYVEGSYDRHVLAKNLTTPDITFGYGGRAQPLIGPGLGVEVDPQALADLTVKRLEISM